MSLLQPNTCFGCISIDWAVKLLGILCLLASGFSFLICFFNAAFFVGLLIQYIIPAVFWTMMDRTNNFGSRQNFYMSFTVCSFLHLLYGCIMPWAWTQSYCNDEVTPTQYAEGCNGDQLWYFFSAWFCFLFDCHFILVIRTYVEMAREHERKSREVLIRVSKKERDKY